MDLENWRQIFRFSANTLSVLSIAIGLYNIYLLPRLNQPFKLICYYFLFTIFAELYTWILTYFNLLDKYGTTINHPYIIVEAMLIGGFFYQLSKHSNLKVVILGLISVVVISEVYIIVFNGITSDSRYGSAILSGLLCIMGLITLGLLSQSKVQHHFAKRPEVQITLGFTCVYALIVSIFFVLPSAIEYSRILANQLLIIKNIFSIISLCYICYGLWRKIDRFKPTAFPVLSPPQGPN